MYRFEPLFQQGHCYVITDFSVGENNGILPLLNHKYKISFFQSTKVTRIDHFDEDVFGFKLEPFSEILSKRYHEKDSVGTFDYLLHIIITRLSDLSYYSIITQIYFTFILPKCRCSWSYCGYWWDYSGSKYCCEKS